METEKSSEKLQKTPETGAESGEPTAAIDPSVFRLAGWDLLDERSKKPEFSSAVEPVPLHTGGSETSSTRRTKSSQRLRYEAEVGVIRKKLGDLEEMRERLGVSQRKMCQLLLVDPSAWTRWTRAEEDAPPHVYRMLQWYLALEEKYPALDVNFWLATVARAEEPVRDAVRDEKIQGLSQNLESVSREVEALRKELASSMIAHERVNQSVEERNAIESRLNLVRRREKLLLVCSALFFLGVLFGFVMHRFS